MKNKLRLVTDADAQWLKQAVEGARYGTEPLTEDEREWLDRVAERTGMGLAQVACRQREAIEQAIVDWERDLERARAHGWWALLGGVLLGLSAGLVLTLLGSLLRWIGIGAGS